MTNIVVAVGLLVTAYQTNELLQLPNSVQIENGVRSVKKVPVLVEYVLTDEIKVSVVTNRTTHRVILGTNGPAAWHVIDTNNPPPLPGAFKKE